MIKNMTVLLPHLEKSDGSTRVGCRPALNGCFITVSDRCREHPAAVQAGCRGASSKQTKRDSGTGIHRCAIFSEEHQQSKLCLYGKYWFNYRRCPTNTWLSLMSQKCIRGEKKPFTTRFPAGNRNTCGDLSVFLGRGMAPGHQHRWRVSQTSGTCGSLELAERNQVDLNEQVV